MKKILLYIFITLSIFIPFSVKAEKDLYRDNIYDIVGDKNSSKVTLYLFHSATCIHCKAEIEYIDGTLKKEYKDKVDFKLYEVSENEVNKSYMQDAKNKLNVETNGVPFTVIGNKTFVGYSNSIGDQIKDTIDYYLENNGNETETYYTIPLIGKVNARNASVPLVAIILGIVDGFNPCAMWILLFLINMLLNMKDRKKMWILGFTFLFTSALVYFLAMLGLSVVLSYTQVTWVRTIIALVAIVGGALNLKTYIETRNDSGCHVVDEKKRKKYFTQIKNLTSEKSLWLALVGVIVLAASVNLVELACSAGFPTIFVSILDLHGITGIGAILYLILYIIFFLLDDMIVFIVAMKTLEVSGFTTKYNKLSSLIGGIIMLVIGLLLIIKPEWVMLNF